MPFRIDKSVAVLCIAIAVFAVVVPAVVLGVPEALLTPVWMYASLRPRRSPSSTTSRSAMKQNGVAPRDFDLARAAHPPRLISLDNNVD